MINQNKFKKVFQTIELGVSSLKKSISISPELGEREKVLAGEGVGSDAHSLRLSGRGGKPEAEADPLMYDGVAGLETSLIRTGEEQGRAFAFRVALQLKYNINNRFCAVCS